MRGNDKIAPLLGPEIKTLKQDANTSRMENSMKPGKIRYSHYALQIAAAACICASSLMPAAIAQGADAAALENWRGAIALTQPGEGCFTVSYPDTIWQQIECKHLNPRVRPTIHKPGEAQVTGNGHDYVAESSGLTSVATGSFPKFTGVKSEKSVGVAAFGDGGILGPNEYSLQLNTNFGAATAACDGGSSSCIVWQQFIYATDYAVEGEGAIFIQNWLIYWGDNPCPSGFGSDGEGDCYGNSNAVTLADIKPTNLGSVTLKGSAQAGGNDTVTVTDAGTAYSVSEPDTTLDISQVWQESEFNVVGDAGGSRAVFNEPVSITVKVALTDGSTAAPKCVANSGTTGETNNLNLGKCTATKGTTPYIEFPETN
jgi:hypothetical protein